MSIQRIIAVISEDDFKNHLLKVRKTIISTRKFILDPKNLNDRRMFYIFRVLGYDGEKKINKHHLNDFQFLIMHILKKSSENRFNDLKKYFNLKDETLDNLKFLMYPDKFAPAEYNKKLEKYGVEFFNPSLIVKKLKFKDYIDLYALMTYVPLNDKSPLIQKILDEILSLNPFDTKISYFKRVKFLYESLNNYEKQIIDLQLKNISFYHLKLMNLKNVSGIVIDGSNVIRYDNQNNINFLLELSESLFLDEKVFFPAVVVFDKNIEYFLNEEGKEILNSFSRRKRIFYNSPADDLIIKISKEKKYYIISNDKFTDYEFDKEKLFEIRRFLNV
jgi:rRNA-processing protein FCF1